MTAAPTDEIYEQYLKKAISEINELGDEVGARGDESHVPVLGSGHPLADVFLLKYEPQPSELQEGVAFFGRTGQALLKSLQRLRVDPMAVYGTNCLKFAGQDEDEARPWLVRELHIVQPKLVVVMGERALAFLNALEFPLSDPLDAARARAAALHGHDRGARHARHRRRTRRAGGEEGVLGRVQGGRRLVGRAPAVLTFGRRLLELAAGGGPVGAGLVAVIVGYGTVAVWLPASAVAGRGDPGPLRSAARVRLVVWLAVPLAPRRGLLGDRAGARRARARAPRRRARRAANVAKLSRCALVGFWFL